MLTQWHTLMHMYTQPYTHHAHTTHKTCMYIHTHNTTHTTMCMQNGLSSLFFASQEGHDKTVEILLQAGATVDLQDKVESCHWLLCENGVHSNLSNFNGTLMHPAKQGLPLTTSLLCLCLCYPDSTLGIPHKYWYLYFS